MAGILALLRALQRVQNRELRSFFSVTLNNFFLLPAVILIGGMSGNGKHPFASSAPVFFVVGIVLFVPLCASPMSRVPASRLALWPLSVSQTVKLRIAAMILNPALWLGVIALVFKRELFGLLAFLLVCMMVEALSVMGRYLFGLLPPFRAAVYRPRVPGRWGGISGLTVSQLMGTLDFYLALFLAVGGSLYRWNSSRVHPEAMPMLGMLIALALSTYPQVAFGLEAPSAISRYMLLPMRGWQIILAKDLGYLAVLVILVLPLNLVSGLTFGMAAIIIGRYPSLRLGREQQRWRFTSGDLRLGGCQIVGGFALGLAAVQVSMWFLAGTALLYLASIPWGGWLWDSKA